LTAENPIKLGISDDGSWVNPPRLHLPVLTFKKAASADLLKKAARYRQRQHASNDLVAGDAQPVPLSAAPRVAI